MANSTERKPRYAVQAVCTIRGSSLENTECKLWFGASRASAERATVNLKGKHGACYRDWQVIELAT